jgi:GT2 family glycosyltransferase
VNPARKVRSPLVRAIMGDPLVRSTAVALRRWVPRPVFAAMQRIDARVREFNARVERRPPLAPELRARLKREFAPEVERLSELLGRDLTHWSQEAATGGGALPVWLPQEQPISAAQADASPQPANRAAPTALGSTPAPARAGNGLPALAAAAGAAPRPADAPRSAPAPVMSVIILNYNGGPWLQRCLESLRRQTLFEQIEVIVADNASPDGSVKLAAGLMGGWRNGRTLQHGENLGYSGGNNRAALQARGQYLFFLNTDTWLEPDCLERMVQEMQTSGAIAAAPAIMDYTNGAIQSTSSRGFDIFGLLSSNAGRMDPGEIFVAEGCSLLIEREWFRKLGGFDDRLFMYADEYDLCWRVWVTGGKVILAPSAKVHHRGAVAVNPEGGERVIESRTSDTKRYYANRNNLVVVLKNSQHLLLLVVPLQLILLGA